MTDKAGTPLQVRHVRTALLREFSELIDLSNVRTNAPQDREQQQLSRSLAALAVRRLTGCTSEQAADSVIDGWRDKGIDAVAILENRAEVFLVQAKWSDQGKAKIDTHTARNMVDGFRQIENRQFERFNDRLQAMSDRLQDVLSMPRLRVSLVQAVMGSGEMSDEVREIFQDAETSFNGLGRYLSCDILSAEDFLNQVRADQEDPPIGLTVPMSQWIHREIPVDAYQGSVAADSIAEWYAEFDTRLFRDNVRKWLGLTAVNQAMVDTLVGEPETFWSRNNGITMLCSRAEARFPAGRRQNAPIHLDLTGVSVVNGAQTVTAISEAFQRAPDKLAEADVSVRVIVLPEDDASFGKMVTLGTNTQNRIEKRDYVALDPTQVAIREDFALTLEKTYVFKRGDIEPAPEEGCSVVNAAVALACAHRNPEFVYRVKQDQDLLWEDERGGAYPVLFGNQPPAVLIWNSVQLFRRINTELHQQKKQLTSRALTIIDHGDLLIAHLVFQALDTESMDEVADWAIPATVTAVVGDAMRWLVYEVDSLYTTSSFVTSTFANHERVIHLAKQVSSRLRTEDTAPEFGAQYQPAPRPARTRSRPAVSVLMDAGHIAEGEPLHYVPINERERAVMADWLAADPRRSKATWVTSRSKPLLWAADGRQYSPSRLVMHMWEEAGWDDAPVAVQGPKCWHLGDEGSLADLAAKLRRAEEAE